MKGVAENLEHFFGLEIKKFSELIIIFGTEKFTLFFLKEKNNSPSYIINTNRIHAKHFCMPEFDIFVNIFFKEIQKLPILTNKTFNFNRNKIPEPFKILFTY